MEIPGFGAREKKFATPEEELAYLRQEVAARERALDAAAAPKNPERTSREVIEPYRARDARDVLEESLALPSDLRAEIALDLAPETHDVKMAELLGYLREFGVKNTLAIVDDLDSPHLEDDFHRFLTELLHERPGEFSAKESNPLAPFRMTLYTIALPDEAPAGHERPLNELISSMEQFYSGMLSVAGSRGGEQSHFSIDIALPHVGEEVSFFVAVPDFARDMFEKQILGIFPRAHLERAQNDYNIFNPTGAVAGAYATLSENAVLPVKTYDHFDHDPLNVILGAFSKIGHTGEGAAVQFLLKPAPTSLAERYQRILATVEGGGRLKDAIASSTILGDMRQGISEFFMPKKVPDPSAPPPKPDEAILERLRAKLEHPLYLANLRLIASAGNAPRAANIVAAIGSAFNQFSDARGNSIRFVSLRGRRLEALARAFSFRTFARLEAAPMNIRECTTLIHFPVGGAVRASSQLKHARAGTAPAPLDVPARGVLLGVNRGEGKTTEIRMLPEDRLRHFYTIGQTGTGKTTLLKNLITQDIVAGEGVCMIDPHGTDILDVLAAIPESRSDDVMYFDPSYTARPIALNMLEYDRRYPEQKTFVVNELFSIFQKLYGAVPESMGPIFEQYFRNATMLVIEDPDTGSTLLDVSRVMSDKAFRDLKLSRCGNPVVVQFWRNIAEKAGGEASLANMVPYITSKFDVFLANDIMRPIIAQERSVFNFREIMDKRKILLVNLAKGRLGDMNAHLIGLILVGKILMATLSRVDRDISSLPPFYLYLDEFQNITTDSIAVILSEARKYRLGLYLAHQFIGQLDEKTRNAVFGNVGSMAAFRVGADDAEFLDKQFSPVFSAHDLTNIENWHAYLKLLANGRPLKPFDIETLPPPAGDRGRIDVLRELSYAAYGGNRADIEHMIAKRYA